MSSASLAERPRGEDRVVRVSSGIMQDKIRGIVEGCKDVSLTFERKEGISLYFSSDSDDGTAVAAAKRAIKSDPLGKTLLVSVKPA